MPATYTVPKTMAAEPTIYSDWNTYLRDNILYLKSKVDIAPVTLLNDTGVHQISNTVTETDGNTYTISGNTMGATGCVIFEMMIYATNTSGGNDQYDNKIYFGGSSVSVFSRNQANGDVTHNWLRVVIKNLTAGSQVYYVTGNSDVGRIGYHGTFAVDTTANVIIKNTHKWGTANANAISNIYWGNVTYLPSI